MNKIKMVVVLAGMLLSSFAATAQPKVPSTLSNPLAQVLVVIMLLLALAIAILGNVVNSAASMFREKLRKERSAAAAKGSGGSAIALLLMAGGLLMALTGNAQAAADAAAAAAPIVDSSINGLSAFTFYLMVAVIAVEILILIALVYQLKFLIGIERKVESKAAIAEAPAKEGWWWKLNKSASKEEEEAIDLSHDYDGISELDNKLPPWWIAAFAITILFSGVYLWRYHVAKSAPLPMEELAISLKEAEIAKNAYLAKTASNVDENSVTMLDEAGIAAGKALFAANCVACHGTAGEGNAVGPNLTDKYWIHGGSISNVFKTIKYGWVEKGMRSWKDDFSPMQMAQLASFVESLAGTNPPNAKEPQGEMEADAPAATVTDSTQATPAAK